MLSIRHAVLTMSQAHTSGCPSATRLHLHTLLPLYSCFLPLFLLFPLPLWKKQFSFSSVEHLNHSFILLLPELLLTPSVYGDHHPCSPVLVLKVPHSRNPSVLGNGTLGHPPNCSFSHCDLPRLPPKWTLSSVFANMANHLFFGIRNSGELHQMLLQPVLRDSHDLICQ